MKDKGFVFFLDGFNFSKFLLESTKTKRLANFDKIILREEKNTTCHQLPRDTPCI